MRERSIQVLSPRQKQMLSMMAEGKTTKAMAFELGLAPETVGAHAREALIKLGARNRAHAVALAYEQGWLVKEAS